MGRLGLPSFPIAFLYLQLLAAPFDDENEINAAKYVTHRRFTPEKQCLGNFIEEFWDVRM